MRYTIEETKEGKFNAILTNPSFNLNTIYTFDTREDAEYFLKANKAQSEERLAGIVTISEYFGKENA